MNHNITVDGGTSVRLPTAGKYCDRDIVVTATGGGGSTPVAKSLIRNGIGYIDTGVDGANSNLTIKIQYEFISMPTGYFNLIYAYVNEQTDATRITYNKHNYVYVCLNSVPSKSLSDTGNRYVNIVYTDTIKPESSTTFSYQGNGTKKTQTRTIGTPLSGKNILMFPASTTNDKVSVKVYSLQIFDGDTLIRDYVPFVTPSGECGMYDYVTKQFYGNDGAGAFDAEQIRAIEDYPEITGG